MNLIKNYDKCHNEGYNEGYSEGYNQNYNPEPCSGGERRCEASVSCATTRATCENFPVPSPCGKGFTLFKLPTVLAVFTVQIDSEAILTLEDPATDIKFIDKDIKITQCHLVPGTDKVFLEGFVKKNIVYSTSNCVNKYGVSGDVRHTTLRVPFSCVTRVCFLPGFNAGNIFEENNRTIEIETQDSCCCGKDKNVLRTEDHNFIHNSVFNEKVYCEIEEADIYESDIEMDRKFGHEEHHEECHEGHREHTFQKVKEKMVIYLRVKLLQNRQVCIPGAMFPGRHGHSKDCDKE